MRTDHSDAAAAVARRVHHSRKSLKWLRRSFVFPGMNGLVSDSVRDPATDHNRANIRRIIIYDGHLAVLALSSSSSPVQSLLRNRITESPKSDCHSLWWMRAKMFASGLNDIERPWRSATRRRSEAGQELTVHLVF